MPYLKVWVHMVWATKDRSPLLNKEIRPELFRHIRENAVKKDIYVEFVNGYVEHVHALVSLKGDQPISRIAQLLKGESTHWANQKNLLSPRLDWQDDYAAFSVSETDVEVVREYIRNQEDHHHKRTFAEEYAELLTKHGLKAGEIQTH